MKISKTELEQIFNEQFESLQEWTPNSIDGPPYPPPLLSDQEVVIKVLALYKSEGVKTFEEVWERMREFGRDEEQVTVHTP